MLNLTHPRYVMPVHGDYRRHAAPRPARRGGRRAAGEHLPRRERPAARDRRARRALRRARAERHDLRRRRRHRRRDRRRPARPPDALRGRHLHRRRHGQRAGRLVGRAARGARPRRPVPRRQRAVRRRAARGGRGLARPRRRAARDARSTCSSRCSTTTSPRSSTTGSSGARWCCRSSSRSSPERGATSIAIVAGRHGANVRGRPGRSGDPAHDRVPRRDWTGRRRWLPAATARERLGDAGSGDLRRRRTSTPLEPAIDGRGRTVVRCHRDHARASGAARRAGKLTRSWSAAGRCRAGTGGDEKRIAERARASARVRRPDAPPAQA